MLEWLISSASLNICGRNEYKPAQTLWKKQSGNNETKDLKMFMAIYSAILLLVIYRVRK